MKVKIRPLMGHGSSDILEFSGDVDLSSIAYWGSHPFEKPVQIAGQVKNLKYGRFTLDYHVDYAVSTTCGRCLCELAPKAQQSFFHMLQEVEQDPLTEDTYIPISDGVLDMELVVSTDLLLSMDDVTLCSPDCKGICPICGSDRNQKDCGCSVTMPDPRFDILRELLDKSSK